MYLNCHKFVTKEVKNIITLIFVFTLHCSHTVEPAKFRAGHIHIKINLNIIKLFNRCN